MAFLIEDVRKESPAPGCKYLFDANVWLAVLDINFSEHFLTPYVDFFNSVYESRLSPKATIVMPSILLSEVFNRLMNDIFYKNFLISHPKSDDQTKASHYKKVYRRAPEYAKDISIAAAQIRAYHQNVTFLSDSFDTFTFKQMTKNIPIQLDFNDHLYCLLAKKLGLTVVTHDSDFAVEDIRILTTRRDLLQL